VIVLTDGEPSDIDVSDPLIDRWQDEVDATNARRSGCIPGIDAYGVVLGKRDFGGVANFRRGNAMMVHRVENCRAPVGALFQIGAALASMRTAAAEARAINCKPGPGVHPAVPVPVALANEAAAGSST